MANKGETEMTKTKALWWGGLILLFASGLLFGLAVAQAEAAEAYILWIETGQIRPVITGVDPLPTGAWPSIAMCHAEKERGIRSFAGLGGVREGDVLVWNFPALSPPQQHIMRWVCLPDTIDPRRR
jgi:hypothetical protein